MHRIDYRNPYRPPDRWYPNGGKYYRNAMRSYHAYSRGNQRLIQKVSAAARGWKAFGRVAKKLRAAARFKRLGMRRGRRNAEFEAFARRERAYVRSRRRGFI